MDEKQLQKYLRTQYPKEDDGCEWKEFKNLKNAWNSDPGSDVESYISAIGNMCGGHLVLGVKEGTLDIVGIRDFSGYKANNVRERLAGRMANLDTEKLKIDELRQLTQAEVFGSFTFRSICRAVLFAPTARLGSA